MLAVVGEQDLVVGFREPAQRLHAALTAAYRDPGRVRMEVLPETGHAFAEEPGTQPAPQTPTAASTAWNARMA